jgi:hypothetical protein
MMQMRDKYEKVHNTCEVNSHVFEIEDTGTVSPIFDSRELALHMLFASRQFETINISN